MTLGLYFSIPLLVGRPSALKYGAALPPLPIALPI